MFKFVLCALLAAAVADPEPGTFISPYTSFGYAGYAPTTYVAPATTTITKTASSYVHNPYFYSSPYYSHFIKKRSAPYYAAGYHAPSYAYGYTAPSYAYGYTAPLVTSAINTPLVHSAPAVSHLTYAAPAHFIKKRSAPLLPSTYIAPTTYAAPVLSSYSYPYAAATPIVSSPLYTSPFGYSHFIKKRSAPLLPYSASYVAPTSYSYSASAPILTSSPYAAASYYTASPYYSAPYAYSTFIKK